MEDRKNIKCNVSETVVEDRDKIKIVEDDNANKQKWK